jgi:hypothetical protein
MTAFDDLSLLRAFVCIVECGSISAGARRLKIPQPTLSRYLRVLEEHSGCRFQLNRRLSQFPVRFFQVNRGLTRIFQRNRRPFALSCAKTHTQSENGNLFGQRPDESGRPTIPDVTHCFARGVEGLEISCQRFWCKLLKGSVSCDNGWDDRAGLSTGSLQGTAF